MIAKAPAGQCRIHIAQFYGLQPRGIVCAAVNEPLDRLATAREDGTIEIWNVAYVPFLEKTITGGKNVSVEALAWAGKRRLFSIGLAGSLLEWDLSPGDAPRVKQTTLVTGGAAWCMDVSRNGRLLAVGTESGYINVYRLENDELTYERILDKQEGRIVCCRFDWSGDFLVTGSADAVRVWDVRNGHAVHKMTTGRADRHQETTVWAVDVAKDFTIVSADSRGRLMVFDGNLGTVLSSTAVSKGDLLCLALSPDGRKLYVGGVEPVIRVYQRAATDEGGPKFIRTVMRRCHTHDIRAMVAFGVKSLFSAGIDGLLSKSTFPPASVAIYKPLLQAPAVRLAAESRMVLLRFVTHLEVWTVARPAGATETDSVSEATGGIKLLHINSKDDEHILCAAISSNARWIVYSTENTVRLLRYDHDPYDPPRSRLQRMRNTPEQFAVCCRADFTPDSSGLFLYTSTGTINFFACAGDTDGGGGDEFFDHKQTIDGSRWLSEMICLSDVSQCGRYLVCADLASAIVVFERTGDGGKWKRSISLPRYPAPPTALAIQPGRTRLAVAFADHKLFLYDFDQFQFVFSTYLNLDRGDVGGFPHHPIGGIAFDPRNESAMLLQNYLVILSLQFGGASGAGDQAADNGSPADAKRRKQQQQQQQQQKQKQQKQQPQQAKEDGNKQMKHVLKKVRQGQRLVSIAWLGEDELVTMESTPAVKATNLPPAFRKKKYGKM